MRALLLLTLILAIAAASSAHAQAPDCRRAYLKRDWDAARSACRIESLREKSGPVAQYYLGEMNRRGLGAKADLAKAAQFYRSAAEANHACAILQLAVLITRRQGSVGMALWRRQQQVRRAAMLGHAAAQLTLATAYANGHGVPRHTVLALAWTLVAASQQRRETKEMLEGTLDALAGSAPGGEGRAAALRQLPAAEAEALKIYAEIRKTRAAAIKDKRPPIVDCR